MNGYSIFSLVRNAFTYHEQVELYEGLSTRSVNCWPSIDVD